MMLPGAFAAAKDHFSKGPSVQFQSPLWDKAIVFVSFLILTLFGIAVGEDLASGGGDVTCLIPNELTKGQTKFVNSFCSGESEVTLLRAMTLFFLGEFLLLTVPHLVWLRLADPHLETFFTMSSQLARVKNNRSKLYDLQSRSFVSQLKSRYSESKLVLRSYYGKLGCQLIFAVVFLVATLGVYLANDFHLLESYFDCTLVREVYARSWFEQFVLFCQDPNTTASSNQNLCQNDTVISVPCVVSLSALFFPLWITSLACLGFVGVCAVFGICWSACRSFPDALGYEGKAAFFYSVSFDLDSYKPNPKWQKSLKIKNDFHFFLVLLSYLDSGLCYAFADVMSELELREKFLKGDNEEKRKGDNEEKRKGDMEEERKREEEERRREEQRKKDKNRTKRETDEGQEPEVKKTAEKMVNWDR